MQVGQFVRNKNSGEVAKIVHTGNSPCLLWIDRQTRDSEESTNYPGTWSALKRQYELCEFQPGDKVTVNDKDAVVDTPANEWIYTLQFVSGEVAYYDASVISKREEKPALAIQVGSLVRRKDDFYKKNPEAPPKNKYAIIQSIHNSNNAVLDRPLEKGTPKEWIYNTDNLEVVLDPCEFKVGDKVECPKVNLKGTVKRIDYSGDEEYLHWLIFVRTADNLCSSPASELIPLVEKHSKYRVGDIVCLNEKTLLKWNQRYDTNDAHGQCYSRVVGAGQSHVYTETALHANDWIPDIPGAKGYLWHQDDIEAYRPVVEPMNHDCPPAGAATETPPKFKPGDLVRMNAIGRRSWRTILPWRSYKRKVMKVNRVVDSLVFLDNIEVALFQGHLQKVVFKKKKKKVAPKTHSHEFKVGDTVQLTDSANRQFTNGASKKTSKIVRVSDSVAVLQDEMFPQEKDRTWNVIWLEKVEPASEPAPDSCAIKEEKTFWLPF